MTVCEINTTETQTKPKNASHCHKPHCHNAYDSVATQPTVPEPTVPEPINPEPMPAPPEPEPETTIAAKPVVNPETTEAKPMPAPEVSCAESHLLPDLPQPMPVVKPETTNMPAPEEHVQKIVRLVLSYLGRLLELQKNPRRTISQACRKD